MITDVVIGLQRGDEGKGKVTHHLLKSGEYTHCIRYSGGCNAGHTIYHKGKKFVTHLLPAGIFHGVRSIIGNGCVIRVDKLQEEIETFEDAGFNIKENLRIASNAHVVTAEHVAEDSTDTRIGTTRTGNGPAYRSKYGRTGTRAEDIPSLQPYLVDMIDELHGHPSPVILMEGAQGFWLDPDWGDYPYVTSAHTGVASALQNGVSPRSLRDVWGVAKVYETYVGANFFQPKISIFDDIQRIGQEFGATTGRVRQCNWIDCAELSKAINVNGVNQLVINKMDVLREAGAWGIRNPDVILGGEDEMIKKINSICPPSVENIYYSDSPEKI